VVVAKKVVSKKMTKEELREDKVLTAVRRLGDFVQQNLRYVIGAAILVALVIVAVGLWNQSRARAEQNASVAMGQAKALYFSGNYAPALAQFQNVQTQFGSASHARTVGLYIGNCQLALGNPVEAEKAFSALRGKVGDEPLLQSAAVRGMGAALADQGKAAEAAARYEEAARVDGNLLAADDWMACGDAYLRAQESEKAKQAFETVVSEHPESPRVAEAKLRLAEIGAI
jgi:TolA-binding protein